MKKRLNAPSEPIEDEIIKETSLSHIKDKMKFYELGYIDGLSRARHVISIHRTKALFSVDIALREVDSDIVQIIKRETPVKEPL